MNFRSVMVTAGACVIWLTTCVGVSAQPVASVKLPLDSAVTIRKLPNGLTYFIRQNRKPEQKVELRLVVNAGSILEDDAQQGLAHMSEHMAFNGTTHFKRNDLISYLQNIGVGFGNDLNAYTSFDETVYMLSIPTDRRGNLEKGFQVLEDWAHGVTYNTEDIEGERAIILEESRNGKGADDRMDKKIIPGLLEGSKYAKRMPIGLDSVIEHFNPDEIRRFYKEWYRPDLMAVIVVGDIDKALAESLVKKHFSSLKNPAVQRPRVNADIPAYTSSNVVIATDKEATSYSVAINYPAYKVTPSTTVGDYRRDLIKNIFSTLLNQRLQELTQQENPPFLYAAVSFSSYGRGYESFSTFANTGTGDITPGVSALIEQMEKVKQYGFTTGELARAKKNILSGYERAYNNRDKTESVNYVQEYVNYFLRKEPTPGIAKEYQLVKELLPGIGVPQVNALANKLKNEKNRFVYVTGPETGVKNLPDGKELLALIDAQERAEVQAYEDKDVSDVLLHKEPVAGKVLSKVTNTLLGTTELSLSNGITVTLKPTTFKNDQVLIGATRAGGKNNYGVADKYNAEYAAAVISSMGIGDFSPTELRKVLAGQSVSIAPVMTNVSEGFRGSSGVKDLETFFQLLYLQVTAPRKDSALFNSFIQKNKSQYEKLGSDPETSFIDTMYRVYYKNNPLAPVAIPKSSYFNNINLERVLDIYKERLGNMKGMNVVIVGSFEEKTIIPYIEKYLASLPTGDIKATVIDNGVRPVEGKQTLLVNKGTEKKGMILELYYEEIPYDAALDMKLEALSEVLNIRILEELREKIQGIYGGGTFASVEKLPYSRFRLVLQLPCNPDKIDTLVNAFQHEFDMLATNGPAPGYVDKVKKQWIESYRTNIRENGTWLAKLLEYKLQGGDPRRFIEYEKYVQQLTAKDVQDAAKLVFHGKNQFTAVLRPEGK